MRGTWSSIQALNWKKLMSLTKFPAPCFNASDYVGAQNWKTIDEFDKVPHACLDLLIGGFTTSNYINVGSR